jgi:hypothetical protein
VAEFNPFAPPTDREESAMTRSSHRVLFAAVLGLWVFVVGFALYAWFVGGGPGNHYLSHHPRIEQLVVRYGFLAALATPAAMLVPWWVEPCTSTRAFALAAFPTALFLLVSYVRLAD